MNGAAKVIRYELQDVLRSRWMLAYALFFLGFCELLFRTQGSGTRVLLSLVNVVLLLVPLVAIVFGTVYLYGSRPFIELLLAQPVSRGRLFAGLYTGLAASLAGAFLLGVGIPFALHGAGEPGVYATLLVLALCGALLTFVFTGLAFWIAVRFEDRLRGFGTAILLWLAFAIVYDGAVLVVAGTFADYPLERAMITLMLLNPVDLARVLMLLRLDVAALMGYTGAAFERFFGSAAGAALALTALLAWWAAPVALGLRAFRRKDF